MSKYLKALAITLFALITGIGVGVFHLSPKTHLNMTANMAHHTTTCATYCLNSNHLPDITPPTASLSQLAASIVGVLVLCAIATLPSILPATIPLARPSPKLVQLYAHYLN